MVRGFLYFSFTFFLFQHHIVAQNTPIQNDRRDEDLYYRLYDNSPRGSSLQWDDLKKLLLSHSIRSIPEALKLLPQELRNQYVVMYMSRSLHEATPDLPRIILFNDKGNLVVTFNGHEKMLGGNALEIMSFDESKAQFEFHEITINPKTGLVISEPNPPKCLACHQAPARMNTDPRPNWEPYSVWPGAIGSHDGYVNSALKSNYDFMRYKKVESDHHLLDLQEQEVLILKKFMSGKKRHPRYSLLGPVRVNNGYRVDEPSNFTELLTYNNARRILRLMEQSPHFTNIKDVVIGYIRCGDPVLSLEQTIWLDNQKTREERLNQKKEPSKEGLYRQTHTPAEFFNLLFDSFGVSTEDWSMEFKTGARFSHEDRFTSPSNSIDHFRRAMNWQMPEVLSKSCDQLIPEARAQFQQLIVQTEQQSMQPKPAIENPGTENTPLAPTAASLIRTCTRCHVEDPTVPHIPFDRPDQLKLKLQQTNYKRGSLLAEIEYRLSDRATARERMPKNLPATAEQIQGLIDYLRRL